MSSTLSVVLHDSRLEGAVPRTYADRVVTVGPGHSIRFVMRMVRGASLSVAGIGDRALRAHARLTIKCHGLSTLDGHFYLQLGDMGLHLGNVATEARMLRDHFHKIKIKACGTNRATPRTEMMQLYAALARETNTLVVASDTRQEYTNIIRPNWHLEDLLSGPMDFGEWEGTLWEFNPNGSRRELGRSEG